MFSMPKPESDELYEHELIRSSSPVSDTTSTLLSFSEPPTPSISVKNPAVQKPKRHLSFRGLKSKRVGIMSDDGGATETPPGDKVANLSDGENLEATKPKKKKNRAIKLIKKLSLRKKHKVGPKVDETVAANSAANDGGGVSSTATTPGSLKRHTPEGATLSMSEGSLHQEQPEPPSDPLKKPETVQITISSKKIEKVNQAESFIGEQHSDRVSPAYNTKAAQQQQQQLMFETHNELIEANPAAAPITAMTEIKTTISNANANNKNYIREQTLILLEKESTSNPISDSKNMSVPTTTSASSSAASAATTPTTTKIIETTTTTRTEQIDQFPSLSLASTASSNTKPVVLAGIEKEHSADSKTPAKQGGSDEDRVGQIVASIVLAQSKLAPSILINKSTPSAANFMKTSDEGSNSEAAAAAPPSLVDDTLSVRVLEANDAVQLGNSLKNRNFTPFISVPSTSLHIREERDGDDQTGEPTNEADQSDIQFDIGTAVRPERTSDISQRKLQHFESIDETESSPPLNESNENSFDSLSPPNSEGQSRRRIAYIQQPTLYTSQEKATLFAKQENSLATELKMAGAAGMSPLEFPIPTTSETEKVAVDNDDDDEDADDNEDEIANNMNPEKREHLYKILVIGELGTGKTSFIKRYVHQFFSQNYRATIGVDFALKVLNWDQDTIIRLQLWDIAGQERFGNMTRVYYKEAVGAFIVFDVTRSATFDAVIKWKQDLDSKVQLPDGSPIPCILLANKCDQTKQGIVTTPAKLDEYVKDHGFAGWFETSAKDNINIEDAAKALVNKILANEKLANPTELVDPEKIALNGKADTVKKSCVC